jgi:hypothetical protein
MLDYELINAFLPLAAMITSVVTLVLTLVLYLKQRRLTKTSGLLDAQLHKTRGDLTALTGSLAGVGQRVLAIENLIAKAFHKSVTTETSTMASHASNHHYQPVSEELMKEPLPKERGLTKAEVQLAKLLKPKALSEDEAMVTEPD